MSVCEHKSLFVCQEEEERMGWHWRVDVSVGSAAALPRPEGRCTHYSLDRLVPLLHGTHCTNTAAAGVQMRVGLRIRGYQRESLLGMGRLH